MTSFRHPEALPERIADTLILVGLFVGLAVVPIVFSPRLYDDFTLPKQCALLVAAALVGVGLGLGGFRWTGGRTLAALLVLWTGMLLLSEATAIDRRGSVLGVYQYRQGLLTQLCYVALFAGAHRTAATNRGRVVLAFPLVGLAGALAYTALQAMGRDPIDWWLDTSDRAIGTIGNANELAAYAVMSLAGCALFVHRTSRGARLGFCAIAASSSFIVLEAESRSGLGALVAFLLALPVCWWLARNSMRALAGPAALVAGGLIAGAGLSLAAGGLAGSAGRVQGGIAGQDAGGSTRMSLWRGTTAVIRAEPLTGAGPDGLFLAFPVHRPANLEGAFETYDLVAQSSHNYILDSAANTGVTGLLALSASVVAAAYVSVRRARAGVLLDGRASLPFVWAALAAYGALTLLNPLSLAAHALFFGVLGFISAGGVPVPARPGKWRRVAGGILAVPLAAATLLIAFQMPRADLEANRGWEDFDAQRFESAADHYGNAAAKSPLQRQYASMRAQALLAASVSDPTRNLARAATAYTELDTDFGSTSGDALDLAAVQIALGNAEAAMTLIDRALALNPHGVAMAEYTERLRAAAATGGVLRYSQSDHWTYIELAPR